MYWFFTYRKYVYKVIVVDIENRRGIDLLLSKENEDVAEWLQTYPNISIVSRGGSISYHSVIRQAKYIV